MARLRYQTITKQISVVKTQNQGSSHAACQSACRLPSVIYDFWSNNRRGFGLMGVYHRNVERPCQGRLAPHGSIIKNIVDEVHCAICRLTYKTYGVALQRL